MLGAGLGFVGFRVYRVQGSRHTSTGPMCYSIKALGSHQSILDNYC